MQANDPLKLNNAIHSYILYIYIYIYIHYESRRVFVAFIRTFCTITFILLLNPKKPLLPL